MKTKEEILNELRQEVESNHENEIQKLKNEQERKLRKKFLKKFLLAVVICGCVFFGSVVVADIFKDEIVLYVVFIVGASYILLIAVFVFIFMDKLINRYVKKRLVLPIINIEEEVRKLLIEEEVRKLVDTRIPELDDTIHELSSTLSEKEAELKALILLQKDWYKP